MTHHYALYWTQLSISSRTQLSIQRAFPRVTRRAAVRALATMLGLLALERSDARAQTPAGFDRAWQDVAAFHKKGVETEGIVGSSLMFVHDGKIIGRSFVGLADKASGRAVDENTIYHWASITKTFTAIAIMQLRDRGLLKLDDPIVNYVPELVAVRDTFGDVGKITLGHLLSHTAGFQNPTWPWGGDKPWHPHEPTDWEQIVAMMPYTEIMFEPGKKYSYSNPGIIFLGRVIEKLSGDDFEVYIDKNIFKPLEMHRSYFDVTPYHLRRYRSNNYVVTNGTPEANGLDFDTGITVSNGGLNAPFTDMVKYLSFLLGASNKSDIHDGVLQRSSLEEMWSPQKVISDSGTTSSAIGMTFFITGVGDTRYVNHTGGQKAFISFFDVQPESRTAAIGAFNTLARDSSKDKPNTRAAMQALRSKLYGSVFPLFAVRGVSTR